MRPRRARDSKRTEVLSIVENSPFVSRSLVTPEETVSTNALMGPMPFRVMSVENQRLWDPPANRFDSIRAPHRP